MANTPAAGGTYTVQVAGAEREGVQGVRVVTTIEPGEAGTGVGSVLSQDEVTRLAGIQAALAQMAAPPATNLRGEVVSMPTHVVVAGGGDTLVFDRSR